MNVSSCLIPSTLLPFGIVWTLYAATYGVANPTETFECALETKQVDSKVFTYTIYINVPLGFRKGIRFAQLSGNKDEPVRSLTTNEANLSKVAISTVPAIGFSKYAMTTSLARDALTIFGSFIPSPRVAAAVPTNATLSSWAQVAISQLSIPAVHPYICLVQILRRDPLE